jgi:hypothetical protein
MGIIAIIALWMLMHQAKQSHPTSGPIPPQLPSPSGPPSLPQPTPAQAAQIANTPPPWPQAIPAGLPSWPTGWTPANPPPSAVVTRAWQLLPTLWAHGAGTKKTEQTAGQWITYVAAYMNPTKTMKGVVAFKPKPQAAPSPEPQPQPVANA